MTAGPLRPSVLHVIVKVQETNGQFSEHCLPLAEGRDLSIVSFLEPTLRAPSTIAMFAGDGTLRGGWRALRSALRAKAYDVVHVHAPQTAVILLIALGWRPSRRANCVYTVQNSYLSYRRRNRMLMAPAFVAYPHVVFCSHAAFESFPRWLIRLVRHKVHVVPNAVDLDGIDRAIDATRRNGHDRFRVLLGGRMVPIKNMATVLDAAARTTSDIDVTVIGDGSLRGDLEAFVDATPALRHRVQFTGLLDRPEVHRRLADADVYVSASLGEGLPVTVLEAMACRTPVLLSDIEPHREIGIDRPELDLVGCTDADGFATAIDGLANLSGQERAALGQRCREIVEERFSLTAMHAGYASIYEAAARAGASRRVGLAWG